MGKVLHITGIIGAFAASTLAVVMGVVWATSGASNLMPPGQAISFGIAGLAASAIAVADGARAMPHFGKWRIGGKFEGIGDLALLLIAIIMAVGIGVGFAFR
jgi:hypothetical protein